MSRTHYRDDLRRPLRDKIVALQNQGASPALLLVCGVPLKIGESEAKLTTGLKTLGRNKANEISALVLDLTCQLDRLAGGTSNLAYDK